MELSGQRFVPAPREKVWRGLQNAATLDACLREDNAVRRVSQTELLVGAPVHGRVSVTETPPGTLAFEAANGRLDVTLKDEGPAMTLLRYRLEAPTFDAARAQTEIDQLLETFQLQVSGPSEFGAEGLAGAQAAASRT